MMAQGVLDGPPGFRARRSLSTLLLTPVGSTGGGLLLWALALNPCVGLMTGRSLHVLFLPRQ
jgi:hypothetical protein